MVNLLATSVLFLISGFASVINIPSIQKSYTNGTTKNHVNNYKRSDESVLEIQMFKKSNYRDPVGTIKIQPYNCVNIPNIDSAILDGGDPGFGTIMFFTENNCMGKAKSNLRLVWLYPGNMQNDLGGRANSVLWINPSF